MFIFKIEFMCFNLQAEWKALMISDKAVELYYLTPEKHAEHFTKRKAGLPSYDI